MKSKSKKKRETYPEQPRKQTPSDREQSLHWDTGWVDNFVMRKTLANNRMKKENLRTESNPRNLSDTEVLALKRAIGNPRSTPNSQLNREPSDIEEGNQTESPKASSVPQTSLEIVWNLEVVTVATRTQVSFRDVKAPVSNITIIAIKFLLRDFAVPVLVDQKVLKIDKNVRKIKSKKIEQGSRKPFQKPANCKNKR
jgi:hypothetical protein